MSQIWAPFIVWHLYSFYFTDRMRTTAKCGALFLIFDRIHIAKNKIKFLNNVLFVFKCKIVTIFKIDNFFLFKKKN